MYTYKSIPFYFGDKGTVISDSITSSINYDICSFFNHFYDYIICVATFSIPSEISLII